MTLDIPEQDDLTFEWSLDAPAEKVWNHLTNAQHLPQWLGSPVELSKKVGGEIRIQHAPDYVCTSIVKRFDPAAFHFEVSWEFPDEHETTVEVWLSPAPEDEGDGATVLNLRHLDLADLRDSYLQGWAAHLTYFEASLAGAPLPPEEFWDVYAAYGNLNAE